jgi:RNA polymerase sigma-70 factor, ECF subfamily
MIPMPAPTPSPSATLVARAQAGDQASFEALYRRQVGRIYALCLRMTGNRMAAEELTQQVFVRAWERLDGFRGDASFGTWLHRLAVNVVLGDRRSQGRRVARFEPTPDPDDHRAPTRPDGIGLDLEAAIAVLPPKARTVFVLHDVQGMSHPEIAQSMGISAGTSKGQLHRARSILREALA